jgi:hypothetical protein
MNCESLQRTEVQEFRHWLRFFLILGSCTMIACFFTTTSSAGQSISTARSHSIVSLASTSKPEGESLARRAGDPRFENAPANYHVFAAASAGEYTGVEELKLI